MLSARYRLLLLSKHHQRQKSYISEESRITLKLGKAKTSSIMHSTLNHHSLSPLFLRKIMTATQNKSQIKRETFQEVLPCRKRVTSLSRAPCQSHLQFKGPFAQNKTVIWGRNLFCSLDLYSLFIWLIHIFALVAAQGDSEKGCAATGNN